MALHLYAFASRVILPVSVRFQSLRSGFSQMTFQGLSNFLCRP